MLPRLIGWSVWMGLLLVYGAIIFLVAKMCELGHYLFAALLSYIIYDGRLLLKFAFRKVFGCRTSSVQKRRHARRPRRNGFPDWRRERNRCSNQRKGLS